jgi:hypothetical protein
MSFDTFFKKGLYVIAFQVVLCAGSCATAVVRRQLCDGSCATAIVLRLKALNIFQKII